MRLSLVEQPITTFQVRPPLVLRLAPQPAASRLPGPRAASSRALPPLEALLQVSPPSLLFQRPPVVAAYRVRGSVGSKARSISPSWEEIARANGCQVRPPSVLRNDRAPSSSWPIPT